MLFRKREPRVLVLEPAFAVRPGDVVIVRAREPLSPKHQERVGEELAALSSKTGARFVVFDDRFEPQKREPSR